MLDAYNWRCCSYRTARYSLPPSLAFEMSPFVGSEGGFAVVTMPPASSNITIPAATSLQQCMSEDEHESSYCRIVYDLPLPTSSFPPYIDGPHRSIGQIQSRTSVKSVISPEYWQSLTGYPALMANVLTSLNSSHHEPSHRFRYDPSSPWPS